MPINVYTGLMRSGKSYEVVSEVIVPAIRKGRRVVTNVDGISQEKIHEYLKSHNPQDDAMAYGLVLHVDNAQVFDPEFFPYYDDQKSAHTETTVQPGDLVCIDEAWRFWGATDCKLHKNHKSFFLEHGHFTDPKTRIACDLVLMIQDMNTLNRFVKTVVAFNFRTHKKVALGLANTYSLTMWEGHKQLKGARIGNWVRKYKKDVFPLYSSFKGGGDGVLVNADSRQNIFSSKKLWIMGLVLILGAVISGINIWKFFNPVPLGKDGKPLGSVIKPTLSAVGGIPPSDPVLASSVRSQSFSETWRIVGTFQAKGTSWVVVTNERHIVRLESPSQFSGSGLVQIGDMDGSKVTSWSGAASSKPGGDFSSTQTTPAAVPVGEVVR